MNKIRICSAKDVPCNGMKAYDTEAGLKVLVANAGDTFYAYQGLCPHQDVCLDEGFFDGATLTCHQHLWQWDITTGEAIGLAEAPLERFELRQEDGEIYVLQGSAVRASELFRGVSEQTLAALDALARREEFMDARTIYDVGDPVDDLYVLESGRIEFLIGREDRTSLAGFVLRKGEVFGWAALLDDQRRRIARASCLEKSSVLRLDGQKVLELLAADPASGFLVMRQLSKLITRHLTAAGDK